MGKGKLVVFEGIDGSGKSLQLRLLRQRCRQEGIKAIFTREYTKGVVGQLIEEVVAGKRSLDPVALQLLFVADRVEHLKRVIEPALGEGKLVVSDRYFWSTVAYGSLVAKQKWLLAINQVCRPPDLVILIDCPVEIALGRIKSNRQRLTIFEKKEKLAKIRRTYLWLARRFSQICQVVDGTRQPEQIQEIIWQRILSLFCFLWLVII